MYLVERCKLLGYKIIIVFLWLDSTELAIERVRLRVLQGGHHIPTDVIKRRYHKGLKNFVNLFMPICDNWIIADNSHSKPEQIASGKGKNTKTINDESKWTQILNYGK